MPKQRDPNSVRTRVQLALLTLGLDASTADVRKMVIASGIKIPPKKVASLAVQVCQVRNKLAAEQGIKVAKGLGRNTTAEREKVALEFKSKVKGLVKHNRIRALTKLAA